MLKSNFWQERLLCRLDMLRLRFSENELFRFLGGDSLSDILRFSTDLSGVNLQKHGRFSSLPEPDAMQSRHVAIASDSGDVKLFFCNEIDK